MDFTKMDVGTIMNGVSPDGARYLQLFLQEYTSVFHETVNPGCSKCITAYLNKYKKMKDTANKSGYRLYAKYENIPLEFGSPILVNNSNINDEYAQKLLKHKDGQRYFAAMPEVKPAKEKAASGNPKKGTAPKKEKAGKEALNEIEITLTADDLAGNPELSETYKEGDIVVISKKEYEADGTISVVDKNKA